MYSEILTATNCTLYYTRQQHDKKLTYCKDTGQRLFSQNILLIHWYAFTNKSLGPTKVSEISKSTQHYSAVVSHKSWIWIISITDCTPIRPGSTTNQQQRRSLVVTTINSNSSSHSVHWAVVYLTAYCCITAVT